MSSDAKPAAAPPDPVSLSWTGGRGSKVALRYIPTEVTEAEFIRTLASWTVVKPLCLLYFVPGKTSRKRGRRTGQAYVLFEEDADAERFANQWNASNPYHSAQTGVNRVPSVAVPAPSQRLFRRHRAKKDRIEGTIHKDPEYAAFLARLAPEGRAAAKAEAQAASAEAEQQHKVELAAVPAVVEYLANAKPGAASDGKTGRGRNAGVKAKRSRGRKDADKADAKGNARNRQAEPKDSAAGNSKNRRNRNKKGGSDGDQGKAAGSKAVSSKGPGPQKGKARGSTGGSGNQTRANGDDDTASTSSRSSRNSRRKGKGKEPPNETADKPRRAQDKRSGRNGRKGGGQAPASSKPPAAPGATGAPPPAVGAVRIMRRPENGARPAAGGAAGGGVAPAAPANGAAGGAGGGTAPKAKPKSRPRKQGNRGQSGRARNRGAKSTPPA